MTPTKELESIVAEALKDRTHLYHDGRVRRGWHMRWRKKLEAAGASHNDAIYLLSKHCK